MSTCTEGPPRKKQKISPIKSIPRGNDESKQKPMPDSKEEPFYYTLHLNPDIVLISTDPKVPVNHSFDLEETNTEPNLFIVKKTGNTYDADAWLKYHEHETKDIINAAHLLSNKHVPLLIVTGAGMGCDSGLPDYRSAGGFWNDYKPLFKDKTHALSLYEMSKTDWFRNDPLSAWGFYAHRAKLYRNAVPHDGFNVLFDLLHTEDETRDWFYMTSNIDGQAHKAGFEQAKLYQTHGSLHHLQCLDYCEDGDIVPFYDGYNKMEMEKETCRMKDVNAIPKCEECGAYTRPNVSFFSDTMDTFNNERIIKQKHKFMEWLQPYMKDKGKELVVLEIGCGKSVHSLRWECEYLASLENVKMIRINPTESITMGENSNKSSKNVILKLTAKTGLTAISKYLNK
eukprot:286810_1